MNLHFDHGFPPKEALRLTMQLLYGNITLISDDGHRHEDDDNGVCPDLLGQVGVHLGDDVTELGHGDEALEEEESELIKLLSLEQVLACDLFKRQTIRFLTVPCLSKSLKAVFSSARIVSGSGSWSDKFW